MTQKFNYEVGKKYYYVPDDEREKPRYVEVSKIGRKYAHFENEELYAELDEDYLILKNYGVRGRLYLNENHYNAYCILQDYWLHLSRSYRFPTVTQLKCLLILTEQEDFFREV